MKITIKHLQPFEVLTRISKFKDKMINLDTSFIPEAAALCMHIHISKYITYIYNYI